MRCHNKRWAHSTDPRHGVEQRGYDLIGAALKELRLGADLTQRRLEAMTGIDQTVISRLENGKQYGLRWSRYAVLVAVLHDRQPAPEAPTPWWVEIGIPTPTAWRHRPRADGLMPEIRDEDL